MIVNPICHWSPSGADPGPAPLLNFSPGAAGVDDLWGTGDQLPPEQPFYYSAADMLAAGVTAAPYTIYGFQEAQGSPPQDLVGTNHLSIAGVNVIQDSPAVGFFKNGSFSDLTKRCIQLSYAQTAADYFYHPTAHDPGNNSFAVFAICQYPLFVNNTAMFGKRANTGSAGGWKVRNPHLVRIGNGATYNSINAGTALGGGQWMAIMLYINRTTQLATLYNSVTTGVGLDISTWGAITSADPFIIGASGGLPQNDSMIAYMAFWSGAAAESIEANHAANFEVLWKHGASPLNCPIDRAGLIGEGADLATDSIVNTIVGYNDELGLLHTGWMGGSWGGVANSRNQFPLAYNPAISRSNKLCLQLSANDRYRTSAADSYSDSLTTWGLKTNITVTYAFADRVLGPDGTFHGYAMTSTGSPSLIRDTTDRTALAGETQGFSIMVKRGKGETSDVAGCRLVIWDKQHAAEIAATTFTATDKWQMIYVEGVVPAGCVDTQRQIDVPWAGVNRVISVMKATMCGTTYFDMMPPPSYAYGSGEVTGLASVSADYTGTIPGAFMKGAQGEIEIVFICHGNFVNGERNLFTQRSALGNYKNGHHFSLLPTKQVQVEIRNNGNSIVSTLASAVIADLTTETTAVYRWNVAGLASGNKHEISINGGAFVGLNPAAWTYADTITDFFYGGSPPTSPDRANAQTVSIRIWDAPR